MSYVALHNYQPNQFAPRYMAEAHDLLCIELDEATAEREALLAVAEKSNSVDDWDAWKEADGKVDGLCIAVLILTGHYEVVDPDPS